MLFFFVLGFTWFYWVKVKSNIDFPSLMENTKSGNGIPFLFFVAFLFCFGLTFAAKEKEPVVEKGRIERRNGFGNKKRTADGSPIERSPESSVSDVEHPCQDARHRSVMSETVALL